MDKYNISFHISLYGGDLMAVDIIMAFFLLLICGIIGLLILGLTLGAAKIINKILEELKK